MTYSKILDHPIFLIFLVLLSAGSAFQLGTMIVIGFGFLPIIDIKEIFYLPLIISGFLLLIFKSLSESISHALLSIKFLTKIPRLHSLFFILLFIVFFYLTFTFILEKNIENHSNFNVSVTLQLEKYNMVLYLIAAIFALFGTRYFLPKIPSKHLQKNLEFFEKNIDLTLKVIFLYFFFWIGVSWVEYLRDKDPNLKIVFSEIGITDANAVIVMQANEGFIAYLDQEPSARYIPWHSVKHIISIENDPK